MASRSTSGGTVLASGIRTRERKERKLYSDDWALGDEEIEGHHTFNIEEKITTAKFDLNFVKDMTDSEFNLSYMQKNGFNWPLLFKSKKNLGIVVPGSDFSINDVRLCVGSRRMLDVMDVNTQKNVEMTMKDWQRYYESQDKDKLLNVISLEFSHTKLETLVEAPTVVRQIDWVEKVWPRHLKEAQTESTNVLEDMMYPKVQKYCLMSVSGCYTDFHIDFGGTSVWYHILKGKKIFWLIPPSERNLQLYEQWVLSGKQSDTFFGDTVEKCARVELQAGNTFFIPTGWIHAVYTPDDSLVFGGNFLHSFGIEKQLRVAHVEDTTHVPQKFRYPFFTEMLWYLLERYVHVLLCRTHLTLPSEEQEKFEKAIKKANNNKPKEHIHLTQYELHGMKAIVMYLHSLPTSKKFVPELIKDPIALIRDVRTVVEHHRYDSPELAVTNQPVMEWWEREPVKFTVKRSVCDPTIYVKKRRQSGDEPKSSVLKLPPNAAKVRHRRIRCKECEPCTREECQTCVFCKDMVKYGGGGTMKQTCKLKKCAQPVLPASASCYICHLDGWMRPVGGITVKPSSMRPSSLMECIICFKISHLSCIETEFKGIECTVNEDLPSSWECAECIQLGYHKEYKHNRAPSSRLSSAGSDTIIKSPSALSDAEETKSEIKSEKSPSNEEENVKPTLNGSSIISQEKLISGTTDLPTLKMPSCNQLQNRVSYPLIRPSWVIRPAPRAPVSDPNEDEDEDEFDSATEDERERRSKVLPPPSMRRDVMFPVFLRLSQNTLLNVMRVCRQWAEWAIDPSLWKSVSLAHTNINELKLHGVVRRQPMTLILDWCEISYDEFLWLLCRLPQLQNISCEGLSWRVINPLVSPYCPPLSELSLSFCEGVDDDTLSALLRPPPFNRPGFRDTTSRLRQLSHLRLAGTQVGDTGVSLIARSLPFLTHLDLSGCLRITNFALEFLAHSTSLLSHSLTSLDLRGCHQLTPMILPLLAQLPILSHLALYPCDCIPQKAIKVWGVSNGYIFNDEYVMTRTPEIKKSIDDISDSEVETTPGKKKLQEMHSFQKSSTTCNILKKEGKKNIEKSSCEDEKLQFDNKEFKCEKGKEKQNSNLKPKGKKDVAEIQNTIQKPESPRLKCVLTPLEKSCKTFGGKFHHVGSVELLSTKNEKLNKSNETTARKCSKSCSDSESKSSGLCRRSERSNKGRKYKLSIAKRKCVKERMKGNEKFLETESVTFHPKKLEKPSKSSKPSEKYFSSNLKRKAKYIITRSKKQKMNEEVKKAKPEYEVVQKPISKSIKNIKEGVGKANILSEIDEGLKVRISLKSSQQYVSKLRKKSRDDDSSSASSFPEEKPSTSTCDSNKQVIKRKDESLSSNKSKEQKEVITKTGEFSKSEFSKKRKERRGSSSSSSSSSCPSPAPPCITLPKKLKIELKPISKIGRRKSEILKGASLPGSIASTESNTESSVHLHQSQSSSSGEKSSSRERPERHHRSPRRLSMCQ